LAPLRRQQQHLDADHVTRLSAFLRDPTRQRRTIWQDRVITYAVCAGSATFLPDGEAIRARALDVTRSASACPHHTLVWVLHWMPHRSCTSSCRHARQSTCTTKAHRAACDSLLRDRLELLHLSNGAFPGAPTRRQMRMHYVCRRAA
jgi:hypothetical protein